METLENSILAAKWVKKQKGKIISFLGFDGGKLKKISDLNIHIDTNNGEYGKFSRRLPFNNKSCYGSLVSNVFKNKIFSLR